jgi:hypothetical protein
MQGGPHQGTSTIRAVPTLHRIETPSRIDLHRQAHLPHTIYLRKWAGLVLEEVLLSTVPRRRDRIRGVTARPMPGTALMGIDGILIHNIAIISGGTTIEDRLVKVLREISGMPRRTS